MNCTEIQLKMSECLDGEAHPSEESKLKEHLSECRECWRVYADLKFIKETAAELDDAEPAASVWSRISGQLAAEGVVKAGKISFWERIFPASFSSSLKPALAGAILALIIVGTVYFVRNPARELQSVSTEAAVLLEVQKAESHYQKTIEALSEVSQKRLQSLSPELAQIFADNVATMDYYLKECQDAVRSNPDNPLVHRYLLVAYEKKAELMQTIVNSDSQY
jgi:anti-sigma factor RsiW